MPTICVLNGITVTMYTDDHPPPHVHARYGGQQVVIDIQSGGIIQGRFPPAQLRQLLDWVQRRRQELLADWNLAQQGLPPTRIAP